MLLFSNDIKTILQDQAPDRIADGHPINQLRENPAMDFLTTNLDNLIQVLSGAVI